MGIFWVDLFVVIPILRKKRSRLRSLFSTAACSLVAVVDEDWTVTDDGTNPVQEHCKSTERSAKKQAFLLENLGRLELDS